jgi:hypothetical protein
MNHSSLVLGCGVAMLVACGGSTSKVSGAATQPDAGGDDAAATADAPVEVDAETAPDVVTVQPEAGAEDAAADERIDPIEVGRSWTYDITDFGTYPLCPAGVHSGTALATAMMDGKQAIEVQSACANAGAAYYVVDGDLVQVAVSGAWLTALATPVQEGQTWSEGSESFTWHSAGTVTVPAGTFDDCWSATQNVAYSAYAIFCRGVGPVRWYTKDAQGDGYDAELTAKNF